MIRSVKKRIAFAEKVSLNKIENESQEEVAKAHRLTQQAVSYIKRNYKDKIQLVSCKRQRLAYSSPDCPDTHESEQFKDRVSVLLTLV